jgi:YVTN family beta-propeller protein
MLKRVVFVVGALSALGACVATRSLTAAGPLGILNTATNTLAGLVLVGKAPHWSASSADGRLAFVTNEGSNDVSMVDVESRTVTATIAVGNAPRKIAMQPISGTDATTETTVRTNTARAETGKSLVIDGVSYANHGTKDVRNLSKLELEADDYYFSPTFLRGKPEQKLTLLVESEARTLHNLSISSLGIDKDIPPKGKVRLEVTFPASGVTRFHLQIPRGARYERATADRRRSPPWCPLVGGENVMARSLA